MRRRTKGGLAGLAAVTVLAVMSEIGDDGDSAEVEVAAEADATTAGQPPSGDDPPPSSTRTAVPPEPPTESAEPPSPEPSPSAPGSQRAASGSEADQGGDVESWTVVDVIDGDTVDVRRAGAVETVRIVGIDTPERGECGYDDATATLRDLIGGEDVDLIGTGNDDRDAYDRLLRYVDSGEIDAGYEQISTGMAIARYDSRDGYGRHPREDRYIAADEATEPGYSCTAPEPEPEQQPASETADGTEPWNQPGPDLDCADIGERVRITGEDYHRLDADGDGWGCDSYG